MASSKQMRDDILYSEELHIMVDLVVEQISRTDPANKFALMALGHMHIKLSKMLLEAPSGQTAEGST
jgi:hypothetical protein